MLSTIGYEAATLDDFIHTLVEAGIKTLIDVRDRAQSRRRGFSKTALSERLSRSGIAYLHYRELGDPKEGREAARAGEFASFRAIYRRVLSTPEAKQALRKIGEVSVTGSVCLMCYEADYLNCHRKIVADRVSAATQTEARHLRVLRGGKATKQSGRVRDSRQGASASQQQLL